MSIFTKDAEQIRKAKYRVKNAQGKYEVVYLETSADQVEQTADRVFVTPAEKSQITTNKEAIAAEKSAREAADQALAGRLNVIEGEGEGSVKKALQDAKNYSDAELAKKVAVLENADSALSTRVQANETALGKVAGQIATAKQEAIDAAEAHTNSEITKLKGEMNEADAAIQGRLNTLESNTSDLADIRRNISSNTAAITKEVSDRAAAVKTVNDALTAEIARATQAETTLTGKISNVESEVETLSTTLTGKVDKALEDAKEYAKEYADSKIEEVNSANDDLSGRVDVVEEALGTVDSRISTAKTQAVKDAKDYTDGQVSALDTALKAADAKVLEDAKAYTDEKVGELNTNLTQTINAVDTKADGINAKVVAVEGNVTALTQRVSTNESDIANLKDAVSNKNNNTIVVNTEDEIAESNPTPKVGDIAFVVSSKRAYIYKGVAALAVENVPAGWVVFDEITNELDLKDYLKIADAASTYRRLDTKIVEGDLATELSSKINNKADKSYVDGELAKKTNEAYVNSKVESVVNPVRTQVATNTGAIADLRRELGDEVSRLEELNSKNLTSLTKSIENVDNKVDTLSTSLTDKEAALKAEDTKLNNRINKFAPVISGTEPQGTETGHVWLELV